MVSEKMMMNGAWFSSWRKLRCPRWSSLCRCVSHCSVSPQQNFCQKSAQQKPTYTATDTVAATSNATVAVALVKVSTEANIAIVTVTDTVAVETLDSYSFLIYTSDSI